jgi:hypothetical protein
MPDATRFLAHHLDCDSWYVACQHEHLFVLHLTQGGRKRFALSLECTAPVDKGIYHGSIVSSVSILPLAGEPDLSAEQIAQIKRGLIELAWGVHA